MEYKIVYDVDWSGLKDIVAYIERGLQKKSNLIEAVATAKDYAIQEWLNTAASKFTHSQGGYARGIVDGEEYPYQGDPLHAKITNRTPYAAALENGVAPWDMKKILQTSNKVRINKEGKKYLIIPFRHGIPGTKSLRAMPQNVYNNAPIYRKENVAGVSVWVMDAERSGARNLRYSAITRTFKEGSVRGAFNEQDAALLRRTNPTKVIRNEYSWGERLKNVNEPKLKAHHKTNIYEGMVRFQTNPNINREQHNMGKFVYNPYNETDNMRNNSVYMTFRVMSEDSQGWKHPGIKAMYIAKQTKERIEAPIRRMIADAALKDLEAIGLKK